MAFVFNTIGGLIGVGTLWVTEGATGRVGEISRVNNSKSVWGKIFWVVTVVFVETFFESVVHGVDGGLAIFISLEGVKIRFLDEKKHKK